MKGQQHIEDAQHHYHWGNADKTKMKTHYLLTRMAKVKKIESTE